MVERDDLDRMIDAAMATYAEPEPGLEARVLVGIAADHEPRQRALHRLLPWLIAIPACACVLVILLTRNPHSHAHRGLTPPVASSLENRPAAPRPPAGAMHVRHPALKRKHIIPSLVAIDRPKLEVFPTPQPLTAEEKGIVRIVMQTPTALRQALVASQRESRAPIHISEIQIPPLEPLVEGND